MTRWILSLSLLAAAVLGGEEEAIERCIRSYAASLAAAAEDIEFGSSFEDRRHLDVCADEKVTRKLYFWIVSWHENGLAMEANATNFNFEEMQIAKDTAVAITDERWIYSYRRKTPHGFRLAYPPTATRYRVRYRLKRGANGWRITAVEVLEEHSQRLEAKQKK